MGKYKKKQIVNAKPKNEHMILNNFFRPLHIFPMLLGHQEALPKHLHHSWSQSIQFLENWHICLKTGQVIFCGAQLGRSLSCFSFKPLILFLSLSNWNWISKNNFYSWCVWALLVRLGCYYEVVVNTDRSSTTSTHLHLEKFITDMRDEGNNNNHNSVT